LLFIDVNKVSIIIGVVLLFAVHPHWWWIPKAKNIESTPVPNSLQMIMNILTFQLACLEIPPRKNMPTIGPTAELCKAISTWQRQGIILTIDVV